MQQLRHGPWGMWPHHQLTAIRQIDLDAAHFAMMSSDLQRALHGFRLAFFNGGPIFAVEHVQSPAILWCLRKLLCQYTLRAFCNLNCKKCKQVFSIFFKQWFAMVCMSFKQCRFEPVAAPVLADHLEAIEHSCAELLAGQQQGCCWPFNTGCKALPLGLHANLGHLNF